MASSAKWSAGTSVSHTNLNDGVTSIPTATSGTMLMGFRIKWNGASWEADALIGNVAEVGNLSFAFASSVLTITLTLSNDGWSAAPVVVASPTQANAAYIPKARASGANEIKVQFHSIAGGTTPIASVDTNMDCQMLIFGEIG